MPYLILIFGLITAIYALYLFMLKSDVADVRRFLRLALALLFGVVLLFFAMTGRIVVSLGLLLLCIPFVLSYIKSKKPRVENDSDPPAEDEDME